MCRSLAEARAALERWPEATIDAFVSARGCCTVRVPRLRDQVIGGEAVRSHTVRDPAIAALADRTLAALIRRGFRGPVNVQVFTGERPLLIEVNARLGSASVLSNQATGGRLFASVLAEACGELCDGELDDYQDDVQMIRYWGEIYHHGTRPSQLFAEPREIR